MKNEAVLLRLRVGAIRRGTLDRCLEKPLHNASPCRLWGKV